MRSPAAEREALAKEVGEQQAHPARPRRIDRRQRADRVQAVEQEVRIDLRAQRSQLRLARQHLHLQPPALGLARLLERSAAGSSTASDSRYSSKPNPNISVDSRAKTPSASRPPRRPTSPIQPRASASHAPLLSTAAVRPVVAIRIAPVADSGMLRATYHADRQTNA